MNMESIQQRNELLTKKLLELSATKDDIEEIKEDVDKENMEVTDDKIKIDIDKMKMILNSRLKSYHEIIFRD